MIITININSLFLNTTVKNKEKGFVLFGYVKAVKAAKVSKKDFLDLLNYILKNNSYSITYLSVVQKSNNSIDR